MKRPRFYRAGLAALLLAGACAHQQTGIDPESTLKARAAAYWEHRIKGELEEAYAFELPRIREDLTLTRYIKGLSSEGIRLRTATVRGVTVDDDQGTVLMEFNFRVMGMYTPREGIPMKGNDHWEQVQGVWYHASMPPPGRRLPRDVPQEE